MIRRLVLVVVLALVSVPAVAAAQYNVPSQATGESRMILIAEDPAPTPEAKLELGGELGASLDFLTRDRAPGERALDFTDVVLFRVHGLVAVGKHAEMFAGIDLLPKQPSYTRDRIWQGALLGMRSSFGKVLSAYLRGQGGPGLDRDGSWISGEAAAQAKVMLAERTLFWESTFGGTYTKLFPDRPLGREFWQTELLAQTGVAIRERRGVFAAWLTFGFHFPLVGRPEPTSDPTVRALDPQVRVGVQLGMLVGVTKALDLFVEWSTLDRGELEEPNTTLPILSGGFDQQRLLFGFNRRFGTRRR